MNAQDSGPAGQQAMTLLREGLIALRREEFQLALAAFDAALAIDPDAADIYAYRSGAMLALARPLDAQADIARAVALNPESFAVNHKSGELSLRMGDLNSAADSFLKAVRAAEPGSGDQHAAANALALVRVRQKTSISHFARLPRRQRLSSLAGRSPRWLVARVRREPRASVSG